jgi:hypothetical protein
MKKYFFIAIAAVGLFSACSSHDDDDYVTSENPGGVELNDGLMPIKLSFGQTSVETRGTGTVGGGFKDYQGNVTDNKWAKQNVKILMTKKNSIARAEFHEGQGDYIYDHELFIAPSAAIDGIAYPVNDSVKYYPTEKAFDFWGYRLDEAESGAPFEDADSVKVPFIIDGSQDIMVAKAVPQLVDGIINDVDSVKAYAERSSNGVTHLTDNQAKARIFSAYAARAGVQPNLKFRHLLSRLKFHVIPGIEDGKNVYIDSIKVISRAKGDLIVAHTAETDDVNRITWDETVDMDTLVLKERPTGPGATDNDPLVKLQSLQPQGTGTGDTFAGDTIEVGEALLVAPGQSKYELIIYLHQATKIFYNPGDHINPNTGAPYTDAENTVDKDFTYTSEKINVALQPNHSYNVFITVYGLSEIRVTTTLAPWEDGEDFNIQPEDESFDRN